MKDDKHFNYTFTYIVLGTIFVSLYILACTFLEIPKDNLRFADTSLGILLGWMISNGNYLTGGNPSQTKKPSTGETTAEINATITQLPEEKTEE
jgi:hypothetical protein